MKRSGALQVETLEERIRGIIAARKTAEDDNEKLMTEIARLREDHVIMFVLILSTLIVDLRY